MNILRKDLIELNRVPRDVNTKEIMIYVAEALCYTGRIKRSWSELFTFVFQLAVDEVIFNDSDINYYS